MNRYKLLLLMVCIFVMGSLTGCQRSFYGYGMPFNMDTSKRHTSCDQNLAAISADNYNRFMKASYIVVVDKFGNTQKVKISANIARHTWDFQNKLDASGPYYKYVNDDGSTSQVGIDVSEHQGNIDWPVVAANVDFAYIRVGYRGYGAEGNIVKDAYFDSNIAGAAEAGIPFGVYFYSQATTYEEGVEEAQYVIAQLGDVAPTLPIVLDREDPMQEGARTNDMSVEQHTQAALGFLETIAATGRKTMIYTNRMYYTLYLDLERIYQYPVWFAQYDAKPDWPYEFNIWQYTESGTVPGITGPVDINVQMKNVE